MEQLAVYQDLLATKGLEWGLIGPREVDRLWDRHIDNCLAVVEDAQCLPRRASILDIGSGAGLPGMVWAVARPDSLVTLVEPLERRVRFLELVRTELALENVHILRARAEDVSTSADVVTARAVAATKTLLTWLAPLVSQGGHMVLIKGQRAADEVADARGWLRRKHWDATVREVGKPPRTRVVVVQRQEQG